MADQGLAVREAATDLEAFLEELGFERVPCPAFEERGKRLIVRRPLPPPSDHYPPQEFLAGLKDVPFAVTRFGKRKRKGGARRMKRQATGTLVVLSRDSVWYRKRGIDDDTRLDLGSCGIRIERCTSQMIRAATR